MKHGIFIWITVGLLGIGLFLHSNVGFVWEKKELVAERMQQGMGYPGAYAYTIPLDTVWMNQDKRGTSAPAKVLENGIALAVPDAPHAHIADKGTGRYSLWGGNLYFSTSDNSDPRTNGRKYELHWPVPVNYFIVWMVYLLAIIITGFMGYSLRQDISHRNGSAVPPKLTASFSFIERHVSFISWFVFAVSAFLVIAAFIISRTPFFTYSYLASIQSDYGGYNSMALQISDGQWPGISYRTPGYPLFMNLMLAFKNTFAAVAIGQIVLSLLSALLLLWAVYRTEPLAALPAALCLAAWQSSGTKVIMDTAILTDSLYASCLSIMFACILLSQKKTALWLSIASLAGGYAILVRPTGMVVFPVFFIALFHLYLQKDYEWWRYVIVLFTVPAVVALGLMTCNKVMIGEFTMGKGASITSVITAGAFLEEDESYPEPWNVAIREIQDYITPEAKAVVSNSWDYQKFYTAYFRGFYCSKIWNPLARAAKEVGDGRDINKIVAHDAIRKHPTVYGKIVLLNLLTLVVLHNQQDIDYMQHLKDIYRLVILDKVYHADPIEQYYKEFYTKDTLPGFFVDAQGGITMEPFRYMPVYSLLISTLNFWFRNLFWGFALLITVFVSFILCLKNRFRNRVYFLSFLLSVTVLGHNLMIALYTPGELRMSVSLLFANYLSFVLLWVHFIRHYILQFDVAIATVSNPESGTIAS
jgi:hypothetical protein